ncbi:hypothetical protein V8F20_007547 [Naviculisporaceae sp. PSN 640]
MATERYLGFISDESGIPFQNTRAGDYIADKVHKVEGITPQFQQWKVATRKEVPVNINEASGDEDRVAKRYARREAKLLHRARHDHVIDFITTYFGPKRDDGTLSFFIVMPFIERNLNYYIRRPADVGPPILLRWFGCLINVLAHIHSLGIWHRDIKPLNILVRDNQHILLADFDTASVLQHQSQHYQPHYTGIGARRVSRAFGDLGNPDDPRTGTRPYLAPELEIEGPTSAGLPTDVFSLGLVFLEMIASAVGTVKQRRSLDKAKVDKEGEEGLSYAKNLEDLCQLIYDIQTSLDSLPVEERPEHQHHDHQHPTCLDDQPPASSRSAAQVLRELQILDRCKDMIKAQPHERPTAGDLRLWWQYQLSKLSKTAVGRDCDCVCACNGTSVEPELCNPTSMDNELRSKLQRAYESGNRLVAGELKSLWKADLKSDIKLVAAARGGLWDIVNNVAENVSSVMSKDYLGRTALHYLAGEADLAPDVWHKTARILLNKDADILARDFDGRTPLRIAAETGNPEMIWRLLETKFSGDKGTGVLSKFPILNLIAEGNGPKTAGRSLVESLCKGEQVIDDDSNINLYRSEVISGLLSSSNGGRGTENLDQEENGKTTVAPEDKAGAYRDMCPDLCLLLDASDEFIGEKANEDKNGQTLLSRAAMNGHEAIVRLLLWQNAHVDTEDNHGCTPISLAASYGYAGIVRLLLAKLDSGGKTRSQLQSFIDRTDKNNETPLFKTASHGHVAVVKLLLDYDADMSVAAARDKNKRDTALLRASKRGHRAIVRLLLEQDDVERDPSSFAGSMSEIKAALESAESHGHWATRKVLEAHYERRRQRRLQWQQHIRAHQRMEVDDTDEWETGKSGIRNLMMRSKVLGRFDPVRDLATVMVMAVLVVTMEMVKGGLSTWLVLDRYYGIQEGDSSQVVSSDRFIVWNIILGASKSGGVTPSHTAEHV